MKSKLPSPKKAILTFFALVFCYMQTGNAATLNLKLYLQGYYQPGGTMSAALYNSGISTDLNDVDTITVKLVDPINFTVLENVKGILKSDGTCTIPIVSSIGSSYYIDICHRNTLQTTSSMPVAISNVTTYDFSTSASNAYGGNQVEVETGIFAFFSGDIDHNCIINNADANIINDDVINFLFGYLCTDLNGDGFVDNTDLLIADSNNQNQVECIQPGLIPPCLGCGNNNLADTCFTCNSQNTTPSLVINTGYNENTNAALGIGATELNWTITQQPSWSALTIPASASTIYYNPFNNPNFFPFPNSQWISIDASGNGGSNLYSDLPFTFDYEFCLCEDDSVTFDLHSLVDDSLVIFVNDYSTTLTYQSTTLTGQQAGQQNYLYTIFLPKGSHRLKADLRNYGGPLGFDIGGSISGNHLLKHGSCTTSFLFAYAGPDTTLCSPISPIVLHGITNVTGAQITWSSLNGGLIISGQGTLEPTVNGEGCYLFKVVDPITECEYSDTVCISLSTLSVGVTPPANLCFGQQGAISITVNGGIANYSYIISPGNTQGVISNNSPFTTSELYSAGNYTISVTDASGCMTTTSISVTEINCCCVASVIQNSGFTDGLTVTGDIDNGVTVPNWNRATNSPQIIVAQGCQDNGYVRMWGNKFSAESIQQTLSTPILEGHKYKLCFCARWNSINTPSTADQFVRFLFRASNGTLLDNSPTTGAIPRAVVGMSIDITNTGTWVTYELDEWIADADYSTLTISVTNDSPIDDASEVSWGEIDNICMSLSPCDGFPEVDAGADQELCYGSCATLSNPTYAGTTSTWYQMPGRILIANSTTTNVCPTVNTCYMLLVTGPSGCSDSDFVCINVHSISASSSTGTIACFGGSTSVTVSATGGTAPYTGTGTFTASAGAYSYTVTDVNGCTATTSSSVSEPSALTLNTSSTNVFCFGGNNGSIVANASGGTGPYEVAIYTGEITGYTVNSAPCGPSFCSTCIFICRVTTNFCFCLVGSGGGALVTNTAELSAGVYSVFVSDANGCVSISVITITEPTQLNASASAGSIACYGGTTSVTVSGIGGTVPYLGTGSFTQFSGTTSYSITDANGCPGSVTVTLVQPSKVEGSTTTISPGCSGNNGTASVIATGGTGTYSYLWSANAGSQTTATATGLTPGNYSVIITDANGCTGSAFATVGNPAAILPPAPGPISGPTAACRNTTGIVYSVSIVPGATSYLWTLPNGATGISTTNSITISFSSTYNGGFISVAAVNICGAGLQVSKNIPVITTYPTQPSIIAGPAIACGPQTVTYSTTANNALGFNWTVTGGMTILSGQGTNTISVNLPAGFGQGSVQVYSTNCYSNSSVRGMIVVGNPVLGAVSGSNYVCANSSSIYTTAVVPGATSYVWSVTGNATLGATTLTSSTASQVINFGAGWTSGIVTVTGFNSCGSSSKSFTVFSNPSQPGSISGLGTGLCGLTNQTYSIVPVVGATNYQWTVPSGVTINSSTGLSINVNFTPAFTSAAGNICVAAINSCGSSLQRCYTVTSRPAIPTLTGLDFVCKSNSSVPYSATTSSVATSWNWTVTGGATIVPSGSTAIVNYTTATNGTATVRANANNNCGSCQPAQKIVAVNLGCRNELESNDDIHQSEFNVFPNPTKGNVNITFNASGNEKFAIKITDMLGNLITNEHLTTATGFNSFEVNLENVAKGIYTLSINSENGNFATQRIIIE